MLSALSPKRLGKIQDAQVKDTLTRVAALAAGVSKANTSTSPVDIANKAQLEDVGITPAKVAPIGQDAVDLLAAADDRDAKEDAHHEAVAQVDTDRAKLDDNLARIGSKLRGGFGNTSQALTQFGVAPFGGGHNGGRKPAKADSAGEQSSDQKKPTPPTA